MYPDLTLLVKLIGPVLVLCFSCTYHVEDQIKPELPIGCSENITFSMDVQPIIASKCAVSGCHDHTASGGYVYETYAGVKAAIDNKRLLGAIKHKSGFVPMPNNRPKLSDCEIKIIENWIDEGYQNN